MFSLILTLLLGVLRGWLGSAFWAAVEEAIFGASTAT